MVEKKPTIHTKWQDLFSLSHDQEHADVIDKTIRTNVLVSGTNLWVLMFAIAIASIGLNVNSTAVIIGAMLISPLMGPIVGMGYGAAVNDISLIRLSIRNMLIFIVISLLTSTLYFLITPLQQAQSELLARTQPNLWDVLIAFFGGSAGIVALTRKEISNVVPGVAIATALMPPLCTAGFGLAHGNWSYFFGAFYLFSINCVFIAFSTLVFVRLLKLPMRGTLAESTRKLHRTIISLIILAVMLPSSYLAWRLVQQELFTTTVNTVTQTVQQEENFFILRSYIDEKQKSIKLIISGTGDTEKINRILVKNLEKAGIHQPQVQVLYAGGNSSDLELLKEELENNQSNTSLMQTQLQQQQDYINSLLSQSNQKSANEETILKEIQAQYPEAKQIMFAQGKRFQQASTLTEKTENNTENLPKDTTNFHDTAIAWLEFNSPLPDKDKERLSAWLTQRLEGTSVELVITVAE